MSIPQGRSVHVDQYLTDLAIKYRPMGFIGDRVFPVAPVAKQSDSYNVWDLGDAMRRQDTNRAPGTRANKMIIRVSSEQYYAKNYALRYPITKEALANADPAFTAFFEEGVSMSLVDAIYLDWEARVAASLTTAANVGTSVTVASGWQDYTNSDPLGDVWTMLDNLHGATGFWPNRAVFGRTAWKSFSRNDSVISKIHQAGVAGGGPSATPQQVAALLQLQEVLVGDTMQATTNEAAATALSETWGDNVILYFAPDRPSLNMPSAGYTFRWNAPELGGQLAALRRPWNDDEGAYNMEVQLYQDEKITAKPLIGSIRGVNSSQ